jgi:hypothetical protein
MSNNKIMPSEAFIASELFIIGLLNGYFSSNCYINETSIEVTALSKPLIEGISLLCSRIGIFGKIINDKQNIYKLNISSKWIQIFSNKIKLLCDSKNIKLKNIKSIEDINFKEHNDVILDSITKIKLIDSHNYKKMYDLTIPITFNFGLANGLQVRDTASTGYLQRQLIKGLEDLSIKYDGTNRNARGIIIQTVYGENGINQATQTELQINIISMDNNTLSDKLGFSSEQIKKLSKTLNMSVKELTEFNNQHHNKLKNLRDELRDLQLRASINYKILEEKFMLPVNFFRITQDYSNKKEHIELKPQEIEDDIEDFLNNYENRLITSLKPTDKYMKQDDRDLKFLLEVAINEYLAPVKCIFEYGLTRTNFKDMMKEIQLSFIKAIIEPGEMVGIIAAQSVGEPTSQMSIQKDTNIKIIIKNLLLKTTKFKTVQVGEFCDKIIKNNPSLTNNTGHPNSVETDLSILSNEYYIIGVNEKEQTKWNKVSHVSRHPVNGQLMTVTTKSGRSVTTTLSHSHLIRENQTVVPITGSNLKVGMRIPVTKHIDNTFINSTIKIGDQNYILNNLFGWFVGAYLAKGSIDENTIILSNISEQFINNIESFGQQINISINKYQNNKLVTVSFIDKSLAKFISLFVKKVPNFVFTAPNEFKAGLIQAYFDVNDNFQFDESKKQMKISSENKELIKDISLLLNYFDIFGSIEIKDIILFIISTKYRNFITSN